ncbi:MAG: hypothetical protein JWM21_625 [Acidobacteria bacterium]|nr:hypothetical protein [Acidobacteriota bacterium]
MRSTTPKPVTLIYFIIGLGLVAWFSGCGTPATNTNANVSIANTNSTPANVNAAAPATLSGISAREPDKYRATLVLSAETEGGDKAIGIPTLSAAIARNGEARRVAFKLPDGSDLIYIDSGDHHYVVLPGRKQYAELTQEAVGFQIHKLMTPGQIVSHLEQLKGVERVGEEQFNGRTAIKYSYNSSVKTDTQAGDVKNQGFVYVDKDTGLPLRSELHAEAASAVKGVKAAKIVAEMKDINTDVDAAMFEVPPGLSKIPPEQIRGQIDAITNTATTLIKALLANMNTAPAPASSPATATASPSASVKQ